MLGRFKERVTPERQLISTIFVVGVALVALAQCAASSAVAQTMTMAPQPPTTTTPAIDPFHELETKYIFGFTSGSDIGAEGEKSIEFETTSTFQKRQGRFVALEQEVEFEGVPTQYFAYELSAHGMYNNIHGVDGIDNVTSTQFSGLSTDLRYLVIGRGPESPFGLTLDMEPEWARIDDESGAHFTAFSDAFTIIADTELINNRLYGALNLSYEPEVSHAPGDSGWEREATWGVSGAMSYRISPKVTVGGEVEYFRAYDSYGFDAFAGHAVYVGPTLHIQFNGKTMLAMAYERQVYGQEAGDNRFLDLVDFELNRFNMKLEFEF
jgi:Putative MetA-pathway of phenol degradation